MSVKGIFEWDGLTAWMEALAQAGVDVDEAADRALEAGAQVVLPAILERVPVDKGDLKDHLEKTGKGEIVREGNNHTLEIGLLDLGKTMPAYGERGPRSGRKTYPREFLYGIFQEYGTSSMAAQPYIRPGFDNNRSKVRAAEIESLKRDGMA